MFRMNFQAGLPFQSGPQTFRFMRALQTGLRRVPQSVFSHGKDRIQLRETFRSFGFLLGHLLLHGRKGF